MKYPAIFRFNLHQLDGKIIQSFEAELDQGNVFKTNKQAAAIGQSLFSFLAYKDQESKMAVWGGLGNAGEAWAESCLDLLDWAKEGAVTVPYRHNGKQHIFCFTLNRELGARLAPEESWHVTNAELYFDAVTPELRKVV